MGWWDAGGPWGDLGGDKIQELQKMATTKADSGIQHAVPCKQGRRIRHRRIPPARPSNRRTMDSRFESLGLWGVMGSFLEPLGPSFFEPWGSFWGHFWTLGDLFGSLWVSFWEPWGVLWGSWGRLFEGLVFGTPLAHSPSPCCRHQRVANGPKMDPPMELKWSKKRLKHRSKFQCLFGSVFWLILDQN